MAQEVFKAAGDPNVFPDQIKAGLRPGPRLRITRVPVSAQQEAANHPVNVQIPEGTYDPVLGMSYVQLAREGLGYQKSQNGGGSIPESGQVMSPYHRFGSRDSGPEKEKSFLRWHRYLADGHCSSGGRRRQGFLMAGLRKINADVEEAMTKFSATQPERTARRWRTGLKATIALIEQVKQSSLSDEAKYDVQHELEIKRVQFNNALVEALGLSIAATVTPEKEPNPLICDVSGRPGDVPHRNSGADISREGACGESDVGASEAGEASVESYMQKDAWTVKPRLSYAGNDRERQAGGCCDSM